MPRRNRDHHPFLPPPPSLHLLPPNSPFPPPPQPPTSDLHEASTFESPVFFETLEIGALTLQLQRKRTEIVGPSCDCPSLLPLLPTPSPPPSSPSLAGGPFLPLLAATPLPSLGFSPAGGPSSPCPLSVVRKEVGGTSQQVTKLMTLTTINVFRSSKFFCFRIKHHRPPYSTTTPRNKQAPNKLEECRCQKQKRVINSVVCLSCAFSLRLRETSKPSRGSIASPLRRKSVTRPLHPLAMSAGPRSHHTPGTLSAQMSHSVSSSHLRSPSTLTLSKVGDLSCVPPAICAGVPMYVSHVGLRHLRQSCRPAPSTSDSSPSRAPRAAR